MDAQAAIASAVQAANSTGFKAWIMVLVGGGLAVTQHERVARRSTIIEIIHPVDG